MRALVKYTGKWLSRPLRGLVAFALVSTIVAIVGAGNAPPAASQEAADAVEAASGECVAWAQVDNRGYIAGAGAIYLNSRGLGETTTWEITGSDEHQGFISFAVPQSGASSLTDLIAGLNEHQARNTWRRAEGPAQGDVNTPQQGYAELCITQETECAEPLPRSVTARGVSGTLAGVELDLVVNSGRTCRSACRYPGFAAYVDNRGTDQSGAPRTLDNQTTWQITGTYDSGEALSFQIEAGGASSLEDLVAGLNQNYFYEYPWIILRGDDLATPPEPQQGYAGGCAGNTAGCSAEPLPVPSTLKAEGLSGASAGVTLNLVAGADTRDFCELLCSGDGCPNPCDSPTQMWVDNRGTSENGGPMVSLDPNRTWTIATTNDNGSPVQDFQIDAGGSYASLLDQLAQGLNSHQGTTGWSVLYGRDNPGVDEPKQKYVGTDSRDCLPCDEAGVITKVTALDNQSGAKFTLLSSGDEYSQRCTNSLCSEVWIDNRGELASGATLSMGYATTWELAIDWAHGSHNDFTVGATASNSLFLEDFVQALNGTSALFWALADGVPAGEPPVQKYFSGTATPDDEIVRVVAAGRSGPLAGTSMRLAAGNRPVPCDGLTTRATSAGTDRASVSWDGAETAASLTLMLKPPTGDVRTVAVDPASNSTVVEGLDPDTTYTVTAEAQMADGSSTVSKATTVTTADRLPAPQDVRIVAATCDSVTIEWNPAEPDRHHTSYDIFRDGEFVGWDFDETLTQWTFRGLAEDTAYTLGARAINQNTEPSWYPDWPNGHFYSETGEISITSTAHALGALAETYPVRPSDLAFAQPSTECEYANEFASVSWPEGFIEEATGDVFVVNGFSLRDGVTDNWHYDISRLTRSGAPAFNTVRIVMNWPIFEPNEDEFDGPAWAQLDDLIAQADENGLKVILDPIHVRVHGATSWDQMEGAIWNLPKWAWVKLRPDVVPQRPTAVGDENPYRALHLEDTWNNYVDDVLQDSALYYLEHVVERYDGDHRVIAIDLVNEPRNYGDPALTTAAEENQELFDMQIDWVDSLRYIDPDKPFILTPMSGNFDPTCIDFSEAAPAKRPHLLVTVHDYYNGSLDNSGEAYRNCRSRGEFVDDFVDDDGSRQRMRSMIDAWLSELGRHQIPLYVGEYGFNVTEPEARDLFEAKYELYEGANQLRVPLPRTAWVAQYDGVFGLFGRGGIDDWHTAGGTTLASELTGGRTRP